MRCSGQQNKLDIDVLDRDLEQFRRAYLISLGFVYATSHGLAIGVPVLALGVEIETTCIAVDAVRALFLAPHGAFHDAAVCTSLPALGVRPIEGLAGARCT
jgi:hypothetical protein